MAKIGTKLTIAAGITAGLIVGCVGYFALIRTCPEGKKFSILGPFGDHVMNVFETLSF